MQKRQSEGRLTFVLFAPQDLPTGGRDDHVLQCLQHFREMGLVLQRKVSLLFALWL